MSIQYTQGTASESDILTHLTQCNRQFIPPLDQRVDLPEYTKKIFQRAVRFEAWRQDVLAGLLAAYFNDYDNGTAYITNISVLENQRGGEIATVLMGMSREYALRHCFKVVLLHVARKNRCAIHLYEKNGFRISDEKNDVVTMKYEVSREGKPF